MNQHRPPQDLTSINERLLQKKRQLEIVERAAKELSQARVQIESDLSAQVCSEIRAEYSALVKKQCVVLIAASLAFDEERAFIFKVQQAGYSSRTSSATMLEFHR